MYKLLVTVFGTDKDSQGMAITSVSFKYKTRANEAYDIRVEFQGYEVIKLYKED